MAQARASNPSLVFGNQSPGTAANEGIEIQKFCIIAAAHISQLATWRFHQRGSDESSQIQGGEHEIWRLECLTRLHIGNLIYTASVYMTGGATSFEAWYMCIFHPVIEYESWTKGDALSSADFTKDAQNVVVVLGAEKYVHREGNLSTALSTKAVLEVLNRVTRSVFFGCVFVCVFLNVNLLSTNQKNFTTHQKGCAKNIPTPGTTMHT